MINSIALTCITISGAFLLHLDEGNSKSAVCGHRRMYIIVYCYFTLEIIHGTCIFVQIHIFGVFCNSDFSIAMMA